ncbi:MAG: HD domain-containing protein [Saccharofermentanales bacterium]|jgi:uncharacterized protein
MNISEIIVKMINYADGNRHDINHFLKVYAYAKTIGECEKLDSNTQAVLEVAAVIHDIAIPLCREKYGDTNGKHQEAESPVLVKKFLAGTGYSTEFIERVAFLVGHHHTYEGIEGMDYQILVEADYLVNADQSNYSEANIRNMLDRVFKTETGISLLKTMFKIH